MTPPRTPPPESISRWEYEQHVEDERERWSEARGVLAEMRTAVTELRVVIEPLKADAEDRRHTKRAAYAGAIVALFAAALSIVVAALKFGPNK